MIAAFVDLDGTLRPTSKYQKLFPHALEFLQSLIAKNVQVFITTNNTLYTPEQIKNAYFQTIKCEVISPLTVAKNYFKQNQVYPLIVGNNQTKEYFADIKLPTQTGVYLANNVFGDYEHLKNIFKCVNSSDYYVSELAYSTTVSHCGEIDDIGNERMPDVGALVHMIRTITGKEPKVVFGKPEVHMVKDILDTNKYTDCMVVGDSANDANFAKTIKATHQNVRVSLFRVEDDEDLQELINIIQT